MSYADKHPHEAPCAWPGCTEIGDKILVVRGELGWYCVNHRQVAE